MEKYTITYRVNVPFVYNGKTLKPGDEFRPSGGKNDKLLLDGVGKYVSRIESAMPIRKGKR